jgi:hypothetical protein
MKACVMVHLMVKMVMNRSERDGKMVEPERVEAGEARLELIKH